MKKILLFSVPVLLLCATGFAQTKKIAHKSHSGKDSELSIDGADNFGLNPSVIRNTDTAGKAKKDSIKIAKYRESLKKKESNKGTRKDDVKKK